MILIVYSSPPNFPATDQQPTALRAQVGAHWVDYTGTLPTLAEVAAFLNPPQVRSLLSIVTDLNALTLAQKGAVWTDLTSGTPPKWQLSTGPNSGAIAALATTLILIQPVLASLNATDVLSAKILAVATYLLDNPQYLVNPAFAPAINVPGRA